MNGYFIGIKAMAGQFVSEYIDGNMGHDTVLIDNHNHALRDWLVENGIKTWSIAYRWPDGITDQFKMSAKERNSYCTLLAYLVFENHKEEILYKLAGCPGCHINPLNLDDAQA